MSAKLLFVTDLHYQAKGRNYHDEDLYLTSCLREVFDLVICNPRDTKQFEESVDLVVTRNSGPPMNYLKEYEGFRDRANQGLFNTYNSLDGLADQKLNKRYLLDLMNLGLPVIPSIIDESEWNKISEESLFISKPLNGSDSIGLELLNSKPESGSFDGKTIFQPKIDFEYEVSFYFIDQELMYATRSLDERWDMVPYNFSQSELDTARLFVEWNEISYGVQRIDFCKTKSGKLLLVEVEDLNPYLNLLGVEKQTRELFVSKLTSSIKAAVQKS